MVRQLERSSLISEDFFSNGLIKNDFKKRESTTKKGKVDNGENCRGDFVGYFLENSGEDRVKVAV